MGIELMNLKGNITLGGEISGQVELDNTITEEIKEVLNECKHIEIIKGQEGKDRTDVNLWKLKSGIYYFEDLDDIGGFKCIMDGTVGEQHFLAGSGSILIISGHYDYDLIEENKEILFGRIERQFLFIGSPNTIYARFYVGRLEWDALNEYSGSYSLVEEASNKVHTIDPNTKERLTYPTEKAVIDYVGAAIAGIEIPEATGGITEITEDTKAYDLPTGIYKINSDGAYYLYPDDAMWPSLINGVAIISNNLEIDGEYTWIFIGMDDSWAEAHWRGIGYLNPETDEYISRNVGIPEHDGNKRNNLAPESVNNTYYPSTLAVVDYINSKLVPIELDVGSEHADNEYYNANAVDAVLIEVVGLLEGFEERISALENK